MDKVIEALSKLLPLNDLLEALGLSKDYSKAIAVVIQAMLVWGFVILMKRILAKRKNRRVAGNLKPQFDYKSIKEATQHYISTQYQNASPGRQEEPKFTHKYVSKNPLIPFFLKTAFNEKRESERFYLILADSGMGKTTFMINLYMQYISIFNRHKPRDVKMKLFRLGSPETLDLVKEIERDEAINTILLLDALDEDPFILPQSENISDEEAFRKRVDDIIAATHNFCEVVLTCRTQYFPGQEDDPYELKILRPDENGYYILNKLYISPFDDKEVKYYLNKKYPIWRIWQRKQKQQAAQIVKNSPKLIVRPMLLSYIELLVEENKKYKTVYAIYETLIEKWLEREANKRKPLKEREAFINNLRELSQHIAVTIYRQRLGNKGLFLEKEEAIAIAKNSNIELKPDEVTGKSLLTCDGQGNWKFAHKSILEFFLAKHAIENFDFFYAFAKTNFAGMDMTKTFYQERGDFNFVTGGTLKRDKYEVKVSDYFIGKYQVTQKLWREIMGKDPDELEFKGNDNNPVECINWYEAIEFCNKLSKKRGLQPYYNIDKNIKDPNNENTEYDKYRYLITINKNAIGFRLPTEAEWEFAARGGIKSKGFEFAGSNKLDEVGWYVKNSKKTTHPVGQKNSNELGIYDMNGNVWEWCFDWYGEYDKQDTENPQGVTKGSDRVYCGGSWYVIAGYCRVAYRRSISADYRTDGIGFRFAFSL